MYEDIIKKSTRDTCIFYAIKQSLIVAIKLFLVYIVIISGSFLIMPDVYMFFIHQNIYLVIIVLLVVILIQAIKEYRWLKGALEQMDFIKNLVAEKKAGLVKLNKITYEYKRRIYMLKEEIDYLKFFSVIPLFTYWMGRYIESKEDIKDIISINVYNITVVEGFLYLSVLILLIYITMFVKRLRRYKFLNEKLISFGKAKIECEAILKE